MCRCCPCVVFSVVSGLLPLGSVTLPMRLTICFTHTFVDWTRGQPKKSRKNQNVEHLRAGLQHKHLLDSSGDDRRRPLSHFPFEHLQRQMEAAFATSKIGKCSSVLIEVFKSSPAENQTCVARSSGQQVQCGSTRCLQVARLGKDLRWLLFSESESCITAAEVAAAVAWLAAT